MCKVLIVYYSMYGHIYKMAEAVAEGVREVTGCEAIIKRVPERMPSDNELSGASYQGAHVARIALKLKG